MQKGPVGRPKKINPIKSGQLKEGECRYTFITTTEALKKMKEGARNENLKIKEYLMKVLQFYWNSNKNNEAKLKNFLNKRITKY